MFNSKEKKTAHMVQKLRFLVGHLFKKPHHKLELIFRNSDGLRDVGFLALRFRAALRGPRCGNGALSGWPLMKCLSGTANAAARPGSVLSAGSSLFSFFMKENMANLLP